MFILRYSLSQFYSLEGENAGFWLCNFSNNSLISLFFSFTQVFDSLNYDCRSCILFINSLSFVLFCFSYIDAFFFYKLTSNFSYCICLSITCFSVLGFFKVSSLYATFLGSSKLWNFTLFYFAINYNFSSLPFNSCSYSSIVCISSSNLAFAFESRLMPSLTAASLSYSSLIL